MNISNAFPGKYLKSSDLERAIKVTISAVRLEEIVPGEHKPVIFFEKTSNLPNHDEPAMVLNQTNANMLSMAYSGETDEWVGQTIGLWVKKDVEYQGKLVSGLRIKVLDAPAMAEPSFEDDAQQYEAEQKATANTLKGDPDFDDKEIPF